jgi:LPS-assembly protein
VQRWQVLQGTDVPVVSPYERAPQLGLRPGPGPGTAARSGAADRVNRFVLPDRDGSTPSAHRLARARAGLAVAGPGAAPGAWVVPRLSVNLASYRTDQPMADGRAARRA